MGYTQQEQVEIVRDAMILTATIEYEEKKLEELKKLEFEPMPAEPVRKVVKQPGRVEPKMPIVPPLPLTYDDYKHNRIWLMIIVLLSVPLVLIIILLLGTIVVCLVKGGEFTLGVEGLLLICLATIVTGVVYSSPFILLIAVLWIVINLTTIKSGWENKQNKHFKKYQSTKEYQEMANAAIYEAERQTQIKYAEAVEIQREMDRRYEEEKNRYKTVVIPTYEYQHSIWQNKKNKSIAFLEREIAYSKDSLENLYNITKKISATYRELWILKWLYADMSTSDHTIEYAMELLDRDRQRVATENVGIVVSDAISELQNGLQRDFDDIYDAIQDNTETLMEILDESYRTRMENRVGYLVEAYQHWGINRELKKINKKF